MNVPDFDCGQNFEHYKTLSHESEMKQKEICIKYVQIIYRNKVEVLVFIKEDFGDRIFTKSL